MMDADRASEGPLSLQGTLDLLAQTIVNALGFELAAINYVDSPNRVTVVSVAGPDEVREHLLGSTESLENWVRILDACTSWGRLRFLDHATRDEEPSMRWWVPDFEVQDGDDAWHPEDALFAPLHASDGQLLGVLSVDLPRDGRRPDQATRDALEGFGVSAALAIEHANLRAKAEQSEELFRYLASRDPVTGLGNRSVVLERLERTLATTRFRDRLTALLFIDLDGFKRVNDEHSHALGDQVLHALARRLEAAVETGDTVARWGGDEFIVLSHALDDHAAGVALAARIQDAVAEPLRVSGQSTGLTCSIGVVFIERREPSTVKELLRRADIAMYAAKREGRQRIFVFDEVLRNAAEREETVERLVRTATGRDRLVPLFQPIVSLADCRIVGFEVLLRLRDDEGQLMAPDEFLAIAGRTGDLVRMEPEAMRRAFAHAAAWGQLGFPLRVSVNVSVRQLDEIDEFERRVRSALAESGLMPSAVTFELTEHAFFDVSPKTLHGMSRLVDEGLSFSVDDFGTGFGSMTYLRAMPINEIKIDRSFIQHTPTERASSAIVRAHATLARELGVRCVAEGIETPEQHDFLLETGIEYGQGYLYERPLARESFSRLLQNGQALTFHRTPEPSSSR
ncbi:MAG TPA: EAL domain-containing protein [Nocardioidaceae bacterium]|nr:EAL domain-containing protein [Nocardioidaceae bacterium]